MLRLASLLLSPIYLRIPYTTYHATQKNALTAALLLGLLMVGIMIPFSKRKWAAFLALHCSKCLCWCRQSATEHLSRWRLAFDIFYPLWNNNGDRAEQSMGVAWSSGQEEKRSHRNRPAQDRRVELRTDYNIQAWTKQKGYGTFKGVWQLVITHLSA